MTSVGSEFTGPHSAYIALRVPDVAETRAELEAKGIVVRRRDTQRRPSATWRSSRTRTGTALMLHRRYDATSA